MGKAAKAAKFFSISLPGQALANLLYRRFVSTMGNTK